MKKKNILALGLACILALGGCGKSNQNPEPVNALQENIEELGSVFARAECGEFYYRNTKNKVKVFLKTDAETEILYEADGVWRFSAVETEKAYPYLLFDGYTETPQGYTGSLHAYAKETGRFFKVFEFATSNVVVLPTQDENYNDLAWVLAQTEEGASLVPMNMRDGSVEHGQIVRLAELGYKAEEEHVLVELKTDKENPLALTIENKVYGGGSVLSTTTYLYDFENNILSGDALTEEEPEDGTEQND